MTEAERLNNVLEQHAPAIARCLSPLGRASAFPKGIPYQAAQAKHTRLNATIGQVTDGAGSPMPLPSMAAMVPGLDPKMTFLYSPQPGHASLRTLWLARQMALAGEETAGCTLPFTTHGLTHGISLIADMFVDADTTIIVPKPSWGNYNLLFGMRTGAKIVTYDFFDGEMFNLAGLGAVLDGVKGKALVVLNFPSNPTGYSPTPAEADAIVARVAAHTGPLIAVVDDAYQGVVFDDTRLDHSIFWRMRKAANPETTVVLKVDGATKEMLFFPSRIGFLTVACDHADAEAAWESKLNAIVRGTVGSPPGPSQAMMMSALQDHARTTVEFEAFMVQMRERYQALADAVHAIDNPRIQPFPFNSAYFALVGLSADVDPEAVRVRLLEERSVGLIAIPSANALRIAYCSATPDDLTEIMRHVDEMVASM